jgi:hypothetical protein
MRPPKERDSRLAGERNLRPLRLSDLSTPRQRLVRLCQATNYGYIQGLEVKGSEPIFHPEPLVRVEVKLDLDDDPRAEVDLADFALADEICRLMTRLDELANGTIERIEIRAGIPRRLVLGYRSLRVWR